jgi:archaellum biogenesis ATPase FlaH
MPTFGPKREGFSRDRINHDKIVKNDVRLIDSISYVEQRQPEKNHATFKYAFRLCTLLRFVVQNTIHLAQKSSICKNILHLNFL